MQKLTITGIESKQTKTGNTKTVLVCEEGKFYFYRQTKTGVSKAQAQFEKYGFKIGDIIEAEVQTEDKTFNNPKGDEITYKDNWIKFFKEIGGIPSVESPINPLKSSESVSSAKSDDIPTREVIEALNARIDKMAEWAKEVEKRLSGLETLEQAKNPEAIEFHQSFNPPVEEKKKFEFTPKVPWEEAAKTMLQGDNQTDSNAGLDVDIKV